MGVKAEVKNLLGETSVMDTLTADFAQLRTSKSATLQMKKLPSSDGDSLLCVVKTFPEWQRRRVNSISFNQDWQKKQGLPAEFSMENLCRNWLLGLVAKPDTMSEARFDELKGKIELKIVSALLLQHENSLVVRLALPFLSADDKKAVNAIKVQRKFNWNGKTFKES